MDTRMFCLEPLSVSKEFVKQLNSSLESQGEARLTKRQMLFFSICITCIIITNSVCWAKFERSSFGKFCAENISKMFRRGLINWNKLLQASIMALFTEYNITSGVLALDDTDNQRSKSTKTIAKTHKVKDKSSGGYFNGQELLFLILITNSMTIPVGFGFYEPDPNISSWRKQDKLLRKQKVSKKDRPAKPVANSDYPSKHKLGIELLKQFKNNHNTAIHVDAIVADALYGSSWFVCSVVTLYPKSQMISQVQKRQKIKTKGNFVSVEEYFRRNAGVKQSIKIRGEDTSVIIHGARLYLKAHKCKRFIIALKYPGEESYRYLIASNLTWRLIDIASAYTLRWLVEVFIQDWKSYEGWCQLAKHPGDEGSSQGVILSLLCDHCLLLHPEQKASFKNKLPAWTVGSLRDRERSQAVVDTVALLIKDKQAEDVMSKLRATIDNVIPLRASTKHLSGKNLGRLGPTPSLKYMAA